MLVVYYKVRPGESLPQIAAAFGLDATYLAAHNGIEPGTTSLRAGQMLRVSSPGVQPAPVRSAENPAARPGGFDRTDGPLTRLPTRSHIALTIELSAGAAPGKVLAIAQVLKQRGMAATWFATGTWAKAHPSTVARLRRLGHQVENHGFDHWSLRGIGRARAAADIRQAAALLRLAAGAPTKYLRPPFGQVDRDVIAAATGLGHRTVLWSVDSLDWHRFGVETSIAHLTGSGLNGAIVALHANADRFEAVLSRLAKEIEARALQAVTLDQALNETR